MDFAESTTMNAVTQRKETMPIPHHRSQVWGLLPLSFALGASAATAQTTPEPLTPIPAVKLEYRSTLSTYKAYADQPVQSWREANDEVGRIGGWRAYAKEMRAGEPPGAGASAPAVPPAHTMGGKP